MVVNTAISDTAVKAKKPPPPFYGKEDRRILWAMYPDNIEPLPDAFAQKPHFIYVNDAIAAWFADRDDVAVGGDNFVYYREGDSGANFAPDCFVAIGVNKDEVTEDGSYYVWRAGKMIDFAMEIASPSTADKDLRAKRYMYESLGVAEYWMFDPTGGRLYGVPLMGYRNEDGKFVPIPVDSTSEPGVVTGYCEILGLEFRWNEELNEFRIVDPVTGKYFVTYLEYMERAERAEAALTDSEAARIESELELAQSESIRLRAEERARAEAERADSKAERMRAERDARQEAERQAREESERADSKAERMRAERDARQEAEERARTESERLQAERDARQQAEQRAREETERADAEAERLQAERDARQQAEQRAQAQESARQQAEQRAQAAEAEAERLREALRDLQRN